MFDKGYFTGSEMKLAEDLGVKSIVPIPNVASNSSDQRYNVANFIYNKENDTYTYPEQQILRTNSIGITRTEVIEELLYK